MKNVCSVCVEKKETKIYKLTIGPTYNGTILKDHNFFKSYIEVYLCQNCKDTFYKDAREVKNAK